MRLCSSPGNGQGCDFITEYSGTPLLWTPGGPGEKGLISGANLHKESIFGTQQSILYTEVTLFQGCPLATVYCAFLWWESLFM